MRIVAFPENDPAYWANTFEPGVLIFVDGQEVDHVTIADEEAGFVVREEWVDGQPVIEGDEIATVRIYGKVKLVGTRRKAAI